MLDFAFMVDDLPTVLSALPTTLLLTALSLLVALALACAFGAAIISRVRILKPCIIALNTFIKGVPQVVQLLFCYYAAPVVAERLSFLGYTYDPKHPPYFIAAVIALGLNFGAYMTDVVVASVAAVNHDQAEACFAVGMTRRQAWRRIIAPQAVVAAIPDLTNYLIWLLKATSVASIVGVTELLATARVSAAAGYQYMEAYIVAAIIYWALCSALEYLSGASHRRIGAYLPTTTR